MKKILFTSLAVLGLGMAGCSNEDLGVAKSGVDEVRATMGDADSRTAMNGNSVVWSADDAIGIFATGGNASAYTNNKYTLSTGVGSKDAGFLGHLEGQNPVKKAAAFYPYDEGASYDGSKISLTLKDTYTYKEGENNGAPMACLINDDAQSTLSFKNAGALMSVTVNNIPADYTWVKLTSTATQEKTTPPVIAGSAQIAFAEGTPTLTIPGIEGSTSVTINFTAGSVTNKTFYFPLPVADYPALELSIGSTSKSEVLKTKALKAERNGRYTTTITFDEVSGSVPTTVESVSGVAAALANTNSVSVTDVASSESSPTVSIPKKETPAENVSISFENISTTSAVAIKEDGTSGTAPENVLVSVPQLETAPKFEINLPASTVTLAANGETATYDEVTATTAENTLVIGKGVTVNTLKVKAGNVRVNSGAKIGAISRENGNTSTVIIYKEEGAALPDLSNTSAFEVVDAAIADLQNVAKKGGTYTLTADLVLSRTLNVQGSKMTLDLAGHNITPKTGGLDPTDGLNTTDALILVRRGAHLTIKDSSNGKGRIDYNGENTVYAAVKLTDSNDGATGSDAVLTVGGGTLRGYNAGISGNGTRHGTKIAIIGGTIKAASTDTDNDVAGIYHPQDGTLTVSAGTVSGLTGIEIRAGQLTVNGGTIESTATELSKKSNGSGTTIIGAAVAVSQHTTNKALKATTTISGRSVLSGPYALYEEDLQDETATDQISLEVSGGTFNGKVYSENCKSFITGGTFSDLATALPYFGTTANVAINEDCSINNLTIQAGMTVSIDLNKKAITITGESTNYINGNLTLTNGTFNDNVGGLGLTANNAKLELDGINYNSPNSNGIFNDKNIQNTTMIIKNSTIDGGYYGVSTNASTNPVGSATFNFENSHFTAAETPFMINIPATVTIKGCTFSGGNHQAAFIRGGNCTIEDSEFTLNATLSTDHSENNRLKAWQSGNQATFAGITIGNYRNTAYQYPTTVIMKNVKVTTSGINASLFPAMHVCANKDTDKAVTITYDDQCSFTSTGYSTPIEYGTSNITVNNEAKTANIDSN